MTLRYSLTALALVTTTTLSAQERLPVVDGALIIQTDNPASCLAPPDDNGGARFETVLDAVSDDFPGLRAISFEWDSVSDADRLLARTADREGVLIEDVLFEELSAVERMQNWINQSPEMTVHAYPDDTIIPDFAQCQNQRDVFEPPVQTVTTGRAWFLPVSGSASAGGFSIPEDLTRYINDLNPEQVAGKHLAACVLVGGGLTLQPAKAATLAAPVLDGIEEVFAQSDLPSSVDLRMARGLLTPVPLHWRGWDAVLLVETYDEDPGDAACEDLAFDLLRLPDTPMPLLGTDPANAVDTCPVDGLVVGQTLRKQILFESGPPDSRGVRRALTQLDDEDISDINEAVACAQTAVDAGLSVQIHIEGYASTDGRPNTNRNFANLRAQSVRARFSSELACSEGSCDTIQITSVGFGETETFSQDDNGAEALANRVAFLSVTAVDELLPLVTSGPLDTAVTQRYLGYDTNNTCALMGPAPISRAANLLAYMTGDPFGRELMSQVNPPPLILMLHNQQGDGGAAQQRLAAAVQEATRNGTVCGRTDAKARVGYIYTRNGPDFASGQITDDSTRQDYFILPPKLTWIFPLPDAENDPDLSALPGLQDTFGLTSGNQTDLERLANREGERAYRRERLPLVDTLTVNNPYPLDLVLRRLGDNDLGTGWVGLTSGWD